MPKKKATKKRSKSAAKSVQSSAPMQVMTAKQLSILFVLWFIGHVVVIYLANQMFPESVVLGTHFFSSMQALIYSMIVFTLIVVGMMPLVEHVAMSARKQLKTLDWIVIYFLINAVGLWVVARFAEQLGMGLKSWVVAVALAAVIDVVQGILIMKIARFEK